jgi:hypothetical protein
VFVNVPKLMPSRTTVVSRPSSVEEVLDEVRHVALDVGALDVAAAELRAERRRELAVTGDDRPSSKKTFAVGNEPSYRHVVAGSKPGRSRGPGRPAGVGRRATLGLPTSVLPGELRLAVLAGVPARRWPARRTGRRP